MLWMVFVLFVPDTSDGLALFQFDGLAVPRFGKRIIDFFDYTYSLVKEDQSH